MITICVSTPTDIYFERTKVMDSDFRIIFFPANQTANQNPPNLKTQAFKAADGISAAHTYNKHNAIMHLCGTIIYLSL